MLERFVFCKLVVVVLGFCLEVLVAMFVCFLMVLYMRHMVLYRVILEMCENRLGRSIKE